MSIKGILLDIDNTLYNYDKTHKQAFEQFLKIAHEETLTDKDLLKRMYLKARKQINSELSQSASSHNRLLYIQRMLEMLKINSMTLSLKLYNTYWDTFLNEIELYEGVDQFFELHKDKKICLVTDLTAHIQHRKIKKMGLYKYADYLVTSEEAGREKPHPYMFLLALQKMKLNNEEVCMIGDSFQKDIMGASSLNIKSFWLNSNNENYNFDHTSIIELKEFKDLNTILLEIR